MTDCTFKATGRTELLMRRCVDSAVHHAISEFRKELGDEEELTYRLAHAVATMAVQQFSTYIDAELRLIQLRDEMRAKEIMLRPPVTFP